MDWFRIRRKRLVREGETGGLLHHSDPLTIGTDPGRAVADTPLVFLKTGITYLETTGTTPTEDLFFFAAMTLVFADLSPAIAAGASGFLLCHDASSPASQPRYSLLPQIIAVATISGT